MYFKDSWPVQDMLYVDAFADVYLRAPCFSGNVTTSILIFLVVVVVISIASSSLSELSVRSS